MNMVVRKKNYGPSETPELECNEDCPPKDDFADVRP